MIEERILSFYCLLWNIKFWIHFRDNFFPEFFLQQLFKLPREVAVFTFNQSTLHIACNSHNYVFFRRERSPVNHPMENLQSPLVILRPSVKTNSKPCRHLKLSLPLSSGEVTWARWTIPGTIRVSRKATLSTCLSIHITAV